MMPHRVALAAALAVFTSACAQDTEDDAALAEGSATQTPVPSGAVERVPVRIGTDGPGMDACGGYGVVEGLDPAGDNYLAVRMAPDALAEELDRLAPETGVAMCGGGDLHAGWEGVVYPGEGQSLAECGTGTPVSEPQDYTGPCRSGWVSQEFVSLKAG